MTEDTRIALFKGKQIRKTLCRGEWWFSVVDVVEALTDSVNPRDYWYRMKVRLTEEDGLQLSTICRQLKLTASDGKKYETDCADTEGMFRIIQSIPSPKAEPFKRWLAKVGDIAGGARKKLEARLGRSVVTKKNFLKDRESKKKLKS